METHFSRRMPDLAILDLCESICQSLYFHRHHFFNFLISCVFARIQHSTAEQILFYFKKIICSVVIREHSTPSSTPCSSSLGYRLKICPFNFYFFKMLDGWNRYEGSFSAAHVLVDFISFFFYFVFKRSIKNSRRQRDWKVGSVTFFRRNGSISPLFSAFLTRPDALAFVGFEWSIKYWNRTPDGAVICYYLFLFSRQGNQNIVAIFLIELNSSDLLDIFVNVLIQLLISYLKWMEKKRVTTQFLAAWKRTTNASCVAKPMLIMMSLPHLLRYLSALLANIWALSWNLPIVYLLYSVPVASSKSPFGRILCSSAKLLNHWKGISNQKCLKYPFKKSFLCLLIKACSRYWHGCVPIRLWWKVS